MIRKITELLYVGSADDARRHGDEYDYIVSLAAPPKEHESKEFLLEDGDHNYEVFEQAVDYIIEKLDSEHTILVHCQAGMSRSVSACIAAYVTKNNVDYNRAFEKCRHGFQYPASQLLDSARKYIDENK